jgi:hypothetical protein
VSPRVWLVVVSMVFAAVIDHCSVGDFVPCAAESRFSGLGFGGTVYCTVCVHCQCTVRSLRKDAI